jgi:hypothetical protein
MFLENQEFRKKLRKVVARFDMAMVKIVPLGRPVPSKYEVVYAIISGIREPQWHLKLLLSVD